MWRGRPRPRKVGQNIRTTWIGLGISAFRCTVVRRFAARNNQSLIRPPASSGSQPRCIFPTMSTPCKRRPGYDVSVHTLKNALATLIQGAASTFRHQLFEHASHCFNSLHQMIQLRELSLGERSPAFRSASDVSETKEQVPDFTQCKTQLSCTLNDCQAVKHRGVITSLPTSPFRRRKQANPLVISNRRGPKSNLPCNLRNGELSHVPF